MADNSQRTRVIILGGGCGAMSAAFWLTATEALRSQYEVTVYTQGWRLGGKGASGRSTNQRITEHGLHMMMGFYESAFHTIRACYALLDKQPNDAFPTWDRAFDPQRQITVQLQVPHLDILHQSFAWESWNIHLPPLPGTPGDPDATFMTDAVCRILNWLKQELGAFTNLHTRFEQPLGTLIRTLAPDQESPLQYIHDLEDKIVQAAERAYTTIGEDLSKALQEVQGVFKRYVAWWLKYVNFTQDGLHLHGYRLYLSIDLALAGLIGYLQEVWPRGVAGFNDINDQDFKQWLKKWGAEDDAAWSGPIRAIYDLAFAYENGDSASEPAAKIAAGAALHLCVRMWTYKDALLWKMNAGMGDVIFTPLYKVLKKRGVHFKFFHRMTGLHVSEDHKYIARIDLAEQVKLNDDEYQPLLPVQFRDGTCWDCWPAEPLWEQICGGAVPHNFEDPWDTYHTGDLSLNLTQDDLLVLAIPPLALKHLDQDLTMHCPAWQNMLNHMTAVPTASVQLWLKPDLAGLGWPAGPTVSIAYADPLRSWGEMSQILGTENWPADKSPQSCEYLCGTFIPPTLPHGDDPTFLAQQTAKVETLARQWLESNTGHLWPAVTRPNGHGLDWNQVVDLYYRVNITYSEQYVQSFPGSIQYRLEPGGRSFANLYLAGDWTVSSINGGSAEAACESGMQAAYAIIKLHESRQDIPWPPTPD